MPTPDLTLEFLCGAVLLAGVILYALFGGADFGGGIWDLLARGPRAEAQREAVGRAIGPVWEANHVWLIFVIVLVFTIFPPVFAALSVALYIPLTLALLGIVFRGAAFVFRAHGRDAAGAAFGWGRVFAVASTVTPVLFGMCAGAVASGQIRVQEGVVVSSLWRPWLAPFPIALGLLALATCAYLAAVYLTLETDGALEEDFRRRALGAGVAFAILAATALTLARAEAPQIWHGLTARPAAIVVPLALALALLSGWAVWRRRYLLARGFAAAEVAVLLVGWALAQYPYLVVPDLTFAADAAPAATLRVALVVYVLGAIVTAPSLWLLFAVFKGRNPAVGTDGGEGGRRQRVERRRAASGERRANLARRRPSHSSFRRRRNPFSRKVATRRRSRRTGPMAQRECIFCAIDAGAAPASIVHDDEATLAFLDINPVTPGHLLVIPKRHATFLADLDPADGGRLFVVGMRLAAALRSSGLRCEGVNFFLADGEAAGQEVFHVHFHVFPRFADDGVRIDFDSAKPSRADLDSIAGRIRAALARRDAAPSPE
jgi:cytochrome bd ubiquinol oxidase subunit II